MNEPEIWKETDKLFEKANRLFKDADCFFKKLPDGQIVLVRKEGFLKRVVKIFKRTTKL